MTSFENYFKALKKALNRDDIYDIWPEFEPEYHEKEFAWTTLKSLGEALLLNCGQCDGPSDMRHNICVKCVEERSKIASEAYKKKIGKKREKWNTIILCRIHTEL